MSSTQWPSSRDYVEAIQNPHTSFFDPDLKSSFSAVDKLGMPFVTSGQFAYVFKLNSNVNPAAQAVRCFRAHLGDREKRYQLINDHLNKVSAPYFPKFEYDPQGILVRGQRLPILLMEWVDGLPLDVYLPNVLGRPDVLKALADDWLKALQSMRDENMAHGDLQHGNIIVDPCNTFRLVDLDGMFVPAMASFKAAELGHRHYQHPKRDTSFFGTNLDNFSGLVIYLSLLALAEKPNLWKDFHDENLIFTKQDFENTKQSKLFSEVRKIPSLKPFTDTLEKACNDTPSNCPSVLELVTTSSSKLPLWMRKSPSIVVQQTTREVKPGSQTVPRTQTTQWQQSVASPVSTGNSANIVQPNQTIFTPFIHSLGHNSLNYSFLGIFFVWLWFPLLKTIMLTLGSNVSDASAKAILGYLAICTWLGYRRAQTTKVSTVTSTSAQTTNTTSSYSYLPPKQYQPTIYRAPTAITPNTSSSSRTVAQPNSSLVKTGKVVGSKIRFIFHKPSCKWALKISYRNRIEFNSNQEAITKKYKPCGVCKP